MKSSLLLDMPKLDGISFGFEITVRDPTLWFGIEIFVWNRHLRLWIVKEGRLL